MLAKRDLVFTQKWSNVFWLSLGTGAMLVLSMVFLQPFDTYFYKSPYKNLALSGYAPCIMLSALLIHIPELWLFRKQGEKWFIWNELLFVLLGGVLMMTASFIYNTIVINQGSLKIQYWWNFMVGFGSPFFIFLGPFWVYLRQKFGQREAVKRDKNLRFINVRGQNKKEFLRISESAFLYAQAQQNYTEIVYRSSMQVQQKKNAAHHTRSA